VSSSIRLSRVLIEYRAFLHISPRRDGVNNAEPSSVNFPSSDQPSRHVQPALHPRSQFIPFRRISRPTAPSLLRGESAISVASYESLPEDGTAPISPVPAVVRDINRRRDSVKPVDEARGFKRHKVIAEFYETERAYVNSLDLIYSVC